MSNLIPLNSDFKRSLIQSNYFVNLDHNYKDYVQPDWLNFAVHSTEELVSLISAAKSPIKIKEVMNRLGEMRYAFAEQSGHGDQNNKNTFGIWRKSTDLTLSSFSDKFTEKNTKKTGDSTSGNITFFCTVFLSNNKLFKSIKDNILLTVAKDGKSTSTKILNQGANSFILRFIERRNIKIKPENYLQDAEFIELAFIEESTKPSDEEASSNLSSSLSSYYLIKDKVPFIILMEHPHPTMAAQLLDGKINDQFQNCLNSDTVSDEDKIRAIAELIWYCHQVMPFVRGTASILQIFTAALLLCNKINPVRFTGSRLDIDALSLSRQLFADKFLQDYSIL